MYETVGDYCVGCGVSPIEQPQNETFGGDPCESYEVWYALNVDQVQYLKYGYSKEIENFAWRAVKNIRYVDGECVPDSVYAGVSNIYTCQWDSLDIEDCSSINACVPTNTGGGTGSGVARRTVEILKDPVTSCGLNDFNYTGELDESNLSFSSEDSFDYHGKSGGDANHFVSRYGNNQDKKKTKFKIKHEPTISCYLKIWIRKKITKYTIRGNSNEIYDAGEVTYEDFDEYIWSGSGNPCFNNTEELADHPENIIDEDELREVEVDFVTPEETIEEFQEWLEDLNTSTQTLESTLGDLTDDSWAGGGNNVPFSKIPPILGGGIKVDLEFKFSIAEGYEPSWPNE
jgi:hypothetical protein